MFATISKGTLAACSSIIMREQDLKKQRNTDQFCIKTYTYRNDSDVQENNAR
jgi:hypothetical protein